MKATMFQPFSIGVVAENKALKSKVIKVTPSEDLPFIDGEIKENVTATAYAGTDDRGTPYEGTATTDNTIDATWLPYGTNRVTAPDVRRGMRVMLYRMGEDDGKAGNVYWRSMGWDDHLMKLETVIFAFSATVDASKDVIDVESCYFVEVSTHQKHLLMHTSSANGEPFEYLFKFNTEIGDVTLTDDINNKIYMNSGEHQILLENADGAKVELNKKDIYGWAPQNMFLEAVNNIDVKAGNAVNLKAGTGFFFTTGGTTFDLTPGGTTLTTPAFKAVKG